MCVSPFVVFGPADCTVQVRNVGEFLTFVGNFDAVKLSRQLCGRCAVVTLVVGGRAAITALKECFG